MMNRTMLNHPNLPTSRAKEHGCRFENPWKLRSQSNLVLDIPRMAVRHGSECPFQSRWKRNFDCTPHQVLCSRRSCILLTYGTALIIFAAYAIMQSSLLCRAACLPSPIILNGVKLRCISCVYPISIEVLPLLLHGTISAM